MKNKDIIIEMEPDESGTFQPKKIITQKRKRKVVPQIPQKNPVFEKVEQFKQGVNLGIDILERLRRL